MARQYADTADGWALAKRGSRAKAIKITETGDGVAVGTVRDLACPYSPLTPAKEAFRAFVEQLRTLHRGKNPTLAELIDWNVSRLAEEGHQARVAAVTGKQLISHFGADFRAGSISVDACKRFAYAMQADDYSPHTIHRGLSFLRSTLKAAHAAEILSDPLHVRIWNISAPRGREVSMTPEQFWQLYDAATSAHIRLFLMIAIMTAQRRTAICELRWDHVNFDTGAIDFTAAMKKKTSVLDKGYQKSRAIVSMTATLRAHLMAAKASAKTPYVIEYQGRPVSNIYVGVIAARDAAGLPSTFTPHALRHLAATWAANSGLDIEKVAKMTGHRDMRVLEEVYTHRDGSASKAAVDAVEKVLGPRLRIVGGKG